MNIMRKIARMKPVGRTEDAGGKKLGHELFAVFARDPKTNKMMKLGTYPGIRARQIVKEIRRGWAF